MTPRRLRPRRLTSALSGCALAALVVLGLDGLSRGPRVGIAAPPAAKLGEPAPDFEATDLASHKMTLAALRGSPVFLNFWATWCPPCVEEMPSIAAVARRYADKGLRVVAVNVDESPAGSIRKWLETRQIGIEVWLDPSGVVARRFGTFKYPETYILDHTGKIQAKYVGSHPWTEPPFDAMLDALVASAPTPTPASPGGGSP